MDESDILQPGLSIKPIVDEATVKNLLFDIYGLSVTNVKELNGYDDKNYHVIVKYDQNENKNIDSVCKSGYVLKIINSLDSKKVRIFEGQNELMLHLGQHGIKCPKPVLTKNGLCFLKVALKSGSHIIKLLEFIEGTILPQAQITPNLLFQVGEFVAKIDNAIKNFYHPAYDSHKTLWMMEAVPNLSQFLYAVPSEDKRKLVTSVIEEFQSKVLSVSNNLEQGIIHGDFNEQNIIVEKQNHEWKIKAVIDFGDSHKTCYLYEVAVTLAYMILQAKDIDAGAYVLAGYSSVRKMTDQERSLLKVCIAARICQSLVLGAYTNLQDPENSYVLVTAAHGWLLLKQIWNFPEETLLERWKTLSENMSF